MTQPTAGAPSPQEGIDALVTALLEIVAEDVEGVDTLDAAWSAGRMQATALAALATYAAKRGQVMSAPAAHPEGHVTIDSDALRAACRTYESIDLSDTPSPPKANEYRMILAIGAYLRTARAAAPHRPPRGPKRRLPSTQFGGIVRVPRPRHTPKQGPAPAMPSINSMFPSKYLRAGADVPAEEVVVLTIRETKVETVGREDEAEQKPVVYFKETEKGLVLNKTNAGAISKALASDDYATWPGKRISIAATDVEYAGKVTLGLRVRTTPPKADAVAGLKTAEASM